MKCKKQPAFLCHRPVKISNLWEVRVSAYLWRVLETIAKKRRCSYSTITRYCVFRLIEQQNLRMTPLYMATLIEVRYDLQAPAALHRHIVCLYGDDEVLLRMAAMRLGTSVSNVIRLALWLYLPRVAMEIHSHKSVSLQMLFWRGIKRWRQIRCEAINTLGIPTLRIFSFSNFSPHEWWPPSGGQFSLFQAMAA